MRPLLAPPSCPHGVALSAEQQAVLDRVLGHVPARVAEVPAKAGTGKTRMGTVLVCVARHMGLRVCALSFSVNGAGKIVATLTRDHGIDLSARTKSHFRAPGLCVRTFDSLLRSLFERLGVSEATRTRAGLEWQVRTLVELGGDEMLWSGMEEQLWSELSYTAALEEICDLAERVQPLNDAARGVVGPHLGALAVSATRAGLVLARRLDELVARHAEKMADLLAGEFDVFIVDEFQDCSDRDLAPLVALAKSPHAIRLVLLGDRGQSVMRFRGAVGDVRSVFERHGVAVETRALTVNFRSIASLVAAQNTLQLAGGWDGPLAVAHLSLGTGPEPVVAVLATAGLLVQAHVAFLAGCGLAHEDEVGRRRLPGALLALLDERAAFTRARCEEDGRQPLVEIMVPTQEIGDDLESALLARSIDVYRARSVHNPFDSMTAGLLHAWFGSGNRPTTELRILLPRHAAVWRAGLGDEDAQEVRAAGMAVVMGKRLVAATTSDSRKEVVATLLEYCDEVEAHSATGDAGRRYLDEVRRLLEAWERVPGQFTATESIPVFEALFDVRPRPRLRGGQQGPDSISSWLVAHVRDADLPPHEVSGFLAEEYERWQQRRRKEPLAGVIMKTPHGAKGDTVDAALVHRGELVPLPSRHTRFAASSIDDLEALSVAYIPPSRPRYAFVDLCFGRHPRYHAPHLEGWTYFAEPRRRAAQTA